VNFEEIRAVDAKDCLLYLAKRFPQTDLSEPLVAEHLTTMHRVAFCLKLWSSEPLGLPDYSRLFLIESASDAQAHILSLSQGMFRATAFLQRAICENIVRHIYFTDHPIEFSRTIIQGKERPTTEHLFDYARMHPSINSYLSEFNAVDSLHSFYTDLCKFVHASTVVNMELSYYLEDFSLDRSSLVTASSRMLGIHHAITFILLVFHKNNTGRFSDETYRFMLQNLTKSARKAYYSI
jgi:hypothetical protein